ncbi:MAG: hypothetical protein NUW37_08465 [Planctomycetes bacterium]|nr:hypothetical protein [Planctomycetota bacterium]
MARISIGPRKNRLGASGTIVAMESFILASPRYLLALVLNLLLLIVLVEVFGDVAFKEDDPKVIILNFEAQIDEKDDDAADEVENDSQEKPEIEDSSDEEFATLPEVDVTETPRQEVVNEGEMQAPSLLDELVNEIDLNSSPAEAESQPLIGTSASNDSSSGANAAPSGGAPYIGDVFGARSGGGRGVALRTYGGNQSTEDSVSAGLQWLANHQVRGGAFRGFLLTKHFDDLCPADDQCDGAGDDRYKDTDVGLTALAMLAFLGDGSTHVSGRYKDSVAAGLSALLDSQRRLDEFEEPYTRAMLRRGVGAIDTVGMLEGVQRRRDREFEPEDGEDQLQMYNHAIATLAVIEAYAMTKDQNLLRPINAALALIFESQQSCGGWDYLSTFTYGRGDLSITGWIVMVLKDALSARLHVPAQVLRKTSMFIDNVRQPDGRFNYANINSPVIGSRDRKGAGMTAVGMLCDLYLGKPRTSDEMKKSADYLKRNLPRWDLLEADRTTDEKMHTFYYWYYGALSMFQMGGESWVLYNEAMSSELLGHQRTEGHLAGSFDPVDWQWGDIAGRIYSTAFSVLCLEVYYRYKLLDDDTVIRIEQTRMSREQAIRDVRRSNSSGRRIQAIDALLEEGYEEDVVHIGRALDDPDPVVRLSALRALGETKKEVALDFLLPLFKRADYRERWNEICVAVEEIHSQKSVPALIDVLEMRIITDTERNRVATTLSRITGQFHGANPEAWRRWYSGG